MNKKFIVMAAFAAMFSISFTSCSNNDDDLAGAGAALKDSKNLMTFNGYTNNGPSTRGYAANEETDVRVDGMSVWAFDATKAVTADNDFFMGRKNVGHPYSWVANPGYYKPDDVDYFWPQYNLNFVALTPQTGGGIGAISISQAASDKPVMTVGVNVPLTTESNGTYGADKQKDIMIASIEDQAPLTTGSASLTFKHALSQIVFKGIIDNTSSISRAIVKSIKLVNVASNGTITYDSDGDVFSTGSFGEKTKTYAANIVNALVTANSPGYEDGITGQDDAETGRNYQMMILPQTSTECEGITGAENLSQLDAPTAGTYLLVNATLYAQGSNNNTILEDTTNVYIPLEKTTWAPGYKYTYVLKFGDNLLHPITFTASVAEWTDANKNVEF